jgi:hypothetical protein
MAQYTTIPELPPMPTPMDGTEEVHGSDGYNDYALSVDQIYDYIATQLNLSNVDEWSSALTYSTAGKIVRVGPYHFAASGIAGNTDKNPINQANLPYWIPSPGIDALNARCKEPFIDMDPSLDRAGANYQHLIKVDEATIGGTAFNYWRIALDEDVVTGDTDLETALGVGTDYEHPLIDIIAPDSLGTRTLKDGGGRVIRAQSDGGKADTLGESQDDAMQRITGTITAPQSILTGTGAFTQITAVSGSRAASGSANVNPVSFDSANSTSPNAAKTDDDETRMKNIVGGCMAIYSKVPA